MCFTLLSAPFLYAKEPASYPSSSRIPSFVHIPSSSLATSSSPVLFPPSACSHDQTWDQLICKSALFAARFARSAAESCDRVRRREAPFLVPQTSEQPRAEATGKQRWRPNDEKHDATALLYLLSFPASNKPQARPPRSTNRDHLPRRVLDDDQIRRHDLSGIHKHDRRLVERIRANSSALHEGPVRFVSELGGKRGKGRTGRG